MYRAIIGTYQFPTNHYSNLTTSERLENDRWIPPPHLAVDEGDAVSVAGQLSDRLWSVLPQRPSVPHLAQCVVAAREKQLGREVGERHRIHVVLMGINLARRDAKENGFRVVVF